MPIPEDISHWESPQLMAAMQSLAPLPSPDTSFPAQRVASAILNAAQWVLQEGRRTGWEFAVTHPFHESYSKPMLDEAFTNFYSALSQEALINLATLATATEANAAPHPPATYFHILAGNLFLSGIEAINFALLLGAASLVRCSSADRYFPLLWKSALAKADAELAELVTITWWPVDRSDLTRAAASAADCVQVFGSDESVAQIRELVPPDKHFIAHPSKISFAIISADAMQNEPENIARHLAYDFSVYDQQGCLSPRAAFIQQSTGSPGIPDSFRRAFLAEMRRLYTSLPPGQLSLEDKSALARERNEILIAQSLDDTTQLWSDANEPFVASCRPLGNYRPGCMNRFADLRLFSSLGELAHALAPWRGKIAALGFAGNDGAEAFLQFGRSLRANRICAIGSMQKPPLGWSHDGRLALTDVTDHMDVEL